MFKILYSLSLGPSQLQLIRGFFQIFKFSILENLEELGWSGDIILQRVKSLGQDNYVLEFHPDHFQ